VYILSAESTILEAALIKRRSRTPLMFASWIREAPRALVLVSVSKIKGNVGSGLKIE
jgi:hypothetical protein